MNPWFSSAVQGCGRLSLALRSFLVFAAGLASALSLPPIDAWWLLAFTIPGFLMLMKNQRRGFLLGWLFGLGYLIAALNWIGFAFFVNAKADLWMMPFAVGGLAAFLALYWGLAGWLTAKCGAKGYPSWLVFPVFLSLGEWLRGVLFGGFPWAVPGLAVDGMGAVAQFASVIGMNGFTFLLLLWAATPFGWLSGYRKSTSAVVLCLPLLWAWGTWRMAENPTQFVAGVGIRLVQPNISQSDKWRDDNARSIFNQLLALSSRPQAPGLAVTHVIWPESAVPFLLDESVEGKTELGVMLQGTRTLITGAVRRSSPKSANGETPRFFTSVMVFDGAGKLQSTYDKWHLVPGGEYLPLAWLLEPLGFRKVVNVPESFSPGQGPVTLAIPGAGLVSPQICYEAIFPAGAIDFEHRPDWIVNVTNDGWFGGSTGPYQHLAQLRLRAIEQGLPVARAANTGISAVIDPVGRYVTTTRLNRIDARDSQLPEKIQPTVYFHIGDFALLLLLLMAVALGSAIRIRV